jgi:type IV pilus assembly protein PilC
MSAAKTSTASLPLAPAAGLFRQLSNLTDGGFTPAEAVAVLREDEDATGLSATLAEVARDLDQRDSLAAALERHAAAFGEEVVAVVRAAEERNALPQALALLADDFEKRLQLRKGLLTVLFWPAFLLSFLALITMVLMVLVIPAFKDVFSSFGADLPGLTLLVIEIADVFGSYGYIIVPLIVALPFGIAWLRRRTRHGIVIDEFFLKAPGVRRFLLKLLVGRLSALLAGAAASKIPAAVVIGYLRSTLSNQYLKSVVGALEHDVAQGVPLSAAWRKQALLPRGFAQLMDIGERSKKLEQVLARAAQTYTLEAAQAVSVFRQVLVISTYVLAGVIVGITVVAMYLPIFKLGSAI